MKYKECPHCKSKIWWNGFSCQRCGYWNLHESLSNWYPKVKGK